MVFDTKYSVNKLNGRMQLKIYRYYWQYNKPELLV
jgi:hypothetical protein